MHDYIKVHFAFARLHILAIWLHQLLCAALVLDLACRISMCKKKISLHKRPIFYLG